MRAAIFLLAMVFGWSCGSQKSTDPKPLLPEEKTDVWLSGEMGFQHAQAFCRDLSVRVCSSVDAACYPFNENEQCLKWMDLCTPERKKGLLEGTIEFSPSEAKGCYAYFENRALTFRCWKPPAPLGLGCQMPFRGKKAIDATCASSEECAEGAFCEFTQATCAGVCRPLIAAGQSVRADQSCTQGTVARNGVCARWLQAGETCVNVGPDVAGCGSELYCNAQGVCAKQLREGSACSSEEACATGLSCKNRVCTAANYAYALAYSSCTNRPCQHDRVCITDSNFQGATCREPRKLTEKCSDSSECGPGLYCDSKSIRTSGTCQRYCSVEADCRSGQFCNDGRLCQEKSTPFETCTQDRACTAGRCLKDASGSGYCAPTACQK